MKVKIKNLCVFTSYLKIILFYKLLYICEKLNIKLSFITHNIRYKIKSQVL